MAGPRDAGEWLRQGRAVLVIAKKNALVYYLKGPVITFGIVFPVFFFLAFAAGHRAPAEAMVPGIVAMSLFFTSSAVGPLVTPWERAARTYERLVTSPASLGAILAGDVLAGMVFGALLSSAALLIALLFTPAQIVSPLPLMAGWLLGAASFAALGVLMAAPAANSPQQIMMLSNLVRLPLIFVSGVFVPHEQMPAWGQWLSPLSPLSYCADLIRVGFGARAYWSVGIDTGALLAFAVGFAALAITLHRRTLAKTA